MSQSSFSLASLNATFPMGSSSKDASNPAGSSNRLMSTLRKKGRSRKASGMVEVLTSTLRTLKSPYVNVKT